MKSYYSVQAWYRQTHRSLIPDGRYRGQGGSGGGGGSGVGGSDGSIPVSFKAFTVSPRCVPWPVSEPGSVRPGGGTKRLFHLSFLGKDEEERDNTELIFPLYFEA